MGVVHALYRFVSAADGDQGGGEPGGDVPNASRREELPYRIELWDSGKRSVEQVLAVTASAAIGYGAYHAATKEFPDRCVVLKHNDVVLSRWNGPHH
jgi:hypothetical protein